MADTGSFVGVGAFYVTFMLLVALVLVNVVIAVLLDEFSKVSLSFSRGGGAHARLRSSADPSPACRRKGREWYIRANV